MEDQGYLPPGPLCQKDAEGQGPGSQGYGPEKRPLQGGVHPPQEEHLHHMHEAQDEESHTGCEHID